VPAGGMEVWFDQLSCMSHQRSELIFPDELSIADTCKDRYRTLPEGDYTLRIWAENGASGTSSFKFVEQ